MLRPLVNQPQITLFMATIGLTFVHRGPGAARCGARTSRGLELGIAGRADRVAVASDWTSTCRKFDLVAARRRRGAGRGARRSSSSSTRIGRALRAVADDHQAALAVGIPLQQIWAIVWAVAGFVALVAGLLWGARNGVQFALTFVALKALPVLILGGFESIPGAIVGGLIIGATEKLAEVYLGPYVGGGIEGWFPYVLALALPAGAARGPVRREDHPPHLTADSYGDPCSIAKPASSRRPTPPTRRSCRSARTASASR